MSHNRSVLKSVAGGFALLAGGIAAWSTLVERNWYTVRYESVPILPEGSRPMRVLHVSDTHLAPWQEHRSQWVQELASLSPDAVVLTGDLMGHVDARPALIRALSPLAELNVPMFFVHGSNDYYGPVLKNPLKYLLARSSVEPTREPDIDNAALSDALKSLGAIDLNNRAATATINGTETVWFGMNDPHIKKDRPLEMHASIQALGDDLLASSAPRFGVVHAPYQRALGHLVEEGADLIFSGHTHGGQVRLPGVGALTSNSDLPNDQARGLSAWVTSQGQAFLNVSAGIGHSIFAPVRFAGRPEATLITAEAAR